MSNPEFSNKHDIDREEPSLRKPPRHHRTMQTSGILPGLNSSINFGPRLIALPNPGRRGGSRSIRTRLKELERRSNPLSSENDNWTNDPRENDQRLIERANEASRMQTSPLVVRALRMILPQRRRQ